MKIPGWEPISNKQLEDCPGAQIVNGQWYMPLQGCDSLQAVLEDLYLDALLGIWLRTSYEKDGNRYGNCTSEAEEAEPILKEFGIIDIRGNVIKKATLSRPPPEQ